jgi:hypothetical protein
VDLGLQKTKKHKQNNFLNREKINNTKFPNRLRLEEIWEGVKREKDTPIQIKELGRRGKR